VLGAMDDAPVGADHLDAELGEGAGAPEVAGDVEGGLAAEGGEDRVDGGSEVALLLDDLADGLGGDGLDVGSIREGRIGHDGGGVGVDEDDAVPLLLEGLARLHAGVVELAALPDDDGARSENEDGAQVGASWHRVVGSVPRDRPGKGEMAGASASWKVVPGDASPRDGA